MANLIQFGLMGVAFLQFRPMADVRVRAKQTGPFTGQVKTRGSGRVGSSQRDPTRLDP